MAYDHVIIGSGINGLVAAAQLSKRGKVLLLERADQLGGCLRTDEATLPGFVHDVMATTAVLFITGPAFAELGGDLARHGLEFCHSPNPTAVLRPDGSSAVLTTDRAANIAALNQASPGDGDRHAADVGNIEGNAPLLFGLLGGPLWSRSTLMLLLREAWRRGPRNLAAYLGEALASGAPLARNRLFVALGAGALCALDAALRPIPGRHVFRPDGKGCCVRA
jgi:phytoene dehydrogenase-like protein